MRASARSTWLAVGPGRDSLLLGSQNNTAALPATLALLWSSNLVDLSSRCPLGSIQSHLTLEGCLWSLACQSISLGNKANCLRGPTVFLEFLHSLVLASCFICLGYLVRPLTSSCRLSNEGRQEIPLVNFCDSLCWLFKLSLLAWHFAPWFQEHVLCLLCLFIWGKLKQKNSTLYRQCPV